MRSRRGARLTGCRIKFDNMAKPCLPQRRQRGVAHAGQEGDAVLLRSPLQGAVVVDDRRLRQPHGQLPQHAQPRACAGHTPYVSAVEHSLLKLWHITHERPAAVSHMASCLGFRV